MCHDNQIKASYNSNKTPMPFPMVVATPCLQEHSQKAIMNSVGHTKSFEIIV
jgi:hypothetical protein